MKSLKNISLLQWAGIISGLVVITKFLKIKSVNFADIPKNEIPVSSLPTNVLPVLSPINLQNEVVELPVIPKPVLLTPVDFIPTEPMAPTFQPVFQNPTDPKFLTLEPDFFNQPQITPKDQQLQIVSNPSDLSFVPSVPALTAPKTLVSLESSPSTQFPVKTQISSDFYLETPSESFLKVPIYKNKQVELNSPYNLYPEITEIDFYVEKFVSEIGLQTTEKYFN